MNKLLLASAAILAVTADSAMAADLGKGLSWNTELTTTYNVTEDTLASDLETGLAYAINDQVSVYGTFYADVRNTEFTGSEFGVTYAPSQVKFLEASTYVTLDPDFENEQFFVEAVIKF